MKKENRKKKKDSENYNYIFNDILGAIKKGLELKIYYLVFDTHRLI